MENAAGNIPTVPAKTIVQRTKGGWFGADYNMNIYRGCSHGCIYCDSRSLCYRNVDFDIEKAKENALQIIRDELRRKVISGIITTGSMSDCYNRAERDLKLMRHTLELINAFGFGVAVLTKSDLVTRDIDVLQDIKTHSPISVNITITTASDEVCKKVEPNVSTTSERFDAMRKLAQSGIFCGTMLMPLLPFINDTEENIIQIARRTKEAGGRFVYPDFGMTLRQGNREYYYDQLDKYFPGIKEKYIKQFGTRYHCPSPISRKLAAVFRAECERLGLLYDMKAITMHMKAGYENRQLMLDI